MSLSFFPKIDRWRLLEAFLQAIILPLETLYFIVTNDWTQSMLRVLAEVAVDLMLNSVLGGASVAVATIMLVREMGSGRAAGGGEAAAGDAQGQSLAPALARQPAKDELQAQMLAQAQARRGSGRSRIPLISATKMYQFDPNHQSVQTKTPLNCSNLEELRQKQYSVDRSEPSPSGLPAASGRGASRLLHDRLGS